jgi:hypothetical protein
LICWRSVRRTSKAWFFINGLVSKFLVRTRDGGISVTVCQDKAGTDDSLQKAKDWIGTNGLNIGASAPEHQKVRPFFI